MTNNYYGLFGLNECKCRLRYKWIDSLKICEPILSLFAHAANYTANRTDLICKAGFSWNARKGCVVNCSSIEYSTGRKSGAGCECQSNYKWYPSQHACKVNCSARSPIGIISKTGCLCPSKSVWNNTLLSCVPQCSEIGGAIRINSLNT